LIFGIALRSLELSGAQRLYLENPRERLIFNPVLFEDKQRGGAQEESRGENGKPACLLTYLTPKCPLALSLWIF
jgi:hypothetical protein